MRGRRQEQAVLETGGEVADGAGEVRIDGVARTGRWSGVMGFIDRSVAALGLTQQHMPSGAGHDAQEVARIAPMGMIFIPSINGISHSPKEFSKPEDITRGADVLLNAVLEADKS